MLTENDLSLMTAENRFNCSVKTFCYYTRPSWLDQQQKNKTLKTSYWSVTLPPWQLCQAPAAAAAADEDDDADGGDDDWHDPDLELYCDFSQAGAGTEPWCDCGGGGGQDNGHDDDVDDDDDGCDECLDLQRTLDLGVEELSGWHWAPQSHSPEKDSVTFSLYSWKAAAMHVKTQHHHILPRLTVVCLHTMQLQNHSFAFWSFLPANCSANH